jgi:hypothetical protein
MAQTTGKNKIKSRQILNAEGTQTITGVKTFSSFPVTPSSAPTTDYQVSNKKYVTDTITNTIASSAEAIAGTDDTKIMTPLKLRNGLNATGTAPVYGCRAWVNFNGTTNVGGFCTKRGSGNVSSVTDGGVGIYTINFTTAMEDANYAANVSDDAISAVHGSTIATDTFAVGSFRILCRDAANYTTYVDQNIVSVSVFR